MHRSSNISQTFQDDTFASETTVQPCLPQVGCRTQNQNHNLLKLNQNNSCSKSKSIPIIDPQTRMEIVVNGPKNLDSAADSSRILNKSQRNATAETRGMNNLRSQVRNSNWMDSSSRPRPFESSLMVGKSLSQPPGPAGSLCSSYSRRSCRSRTVGKERTLLLGKLNSRLAGMEQEGKRVIVGLEVLEKRLKALVEEAKLTAVELDSEGIAMDKYSAISQHLVHVEDEITMISASLNQWLDVSSDSEELDDSEVSYVEVINDENMAKEVILGGNEENGGFVNEKVEGLSSTAEMIDIGIKAKNIVLDNEVDNIGLQNKHKKNIEIFNIADTNNKANTVNLERNIENGSQVNKKMETVEIESNSSDDNFISFADLINGKEMLDINENIDITEKSCGLVNTNKAVDYENMADLMKKTVVEMPEPKNEEDDLVIEIRSDSLGSTWEDGNNRPFHEDVIEKSKLPALSTGETNSKVREWLNSRWNDVNTSPQTTLVKSFRAKLRPKNDVESKNMKVNSDVSTEEVVKLGPLKILEDESGSFLFKLSTIENPGKFFIYPIQMSMSMAYLTQIHNEIKKDNRKIPDERLVVPDTVWSMFNRSKQGWCRVRVESRSSTSASVSYIDFGTSEEKVDLWFLRHLPDTWVRKLPGLAVQCSLGCCSPVGRDWDAESTAALNKILGDGKEHRAVAIGERNGSLDLLLLAKGKIVNQQMVERGFASTKMTDNFSQFRDILNLYEL